MFKKQDVRAKLSFGLVLVFMLSLVLPVIIGEEQVAVAEGNGTQTIGELDIGDKVVDNSWEWEHRTGDNYSYREGDISKPVTWIVVAKDHYINNEGKTIQGVTLTTEKLIGRHTFDNSNDRKSTNGSYHWGSGSNHYGDSGSTNASYGIRKFLNGSSYNYDIGYGGRYKGAESAIGDDNIYPVTFYDAFSLSFQKVIILTTVPCKANSETSGPYNNEDYTTLDKVFLPSIIELNCSGSKHKLDKVWPYFANSTDEDRKAIGTNGDYNSYWTRTPVTTHTNPVRSVDYNGSIAHISANDSLGVRPALTLSSKTLISANPNPEGAYLIKTLSYGDVTGNGNVNVADAIAVLRHIVGLQTLKQEELERAKVSKEGEGVSVQDAILILRHIVGLIKTFPVEK